MARIRSWWSLIGAQPLNGTQTSWNLHASAQPLTNSALNGAQPLIGGSTMARSRLLLPGRLWIALSNGTQPLVGTSTRRRTEMLKA